MLVSSQCWAVVASEHCSSHPDLLEETSTFPLAPCVQNVVSALAQPFSLFPISLASFHNPWFQFDFVYKVVFFFLAFCFLNKPKSKTNQVSSIALPFLLFEVCPCAPPSSRPSAQPLLDRRCSHLPKAGRGSRKSQSLALGALPPAGKERECCRGPANSAGGSITLTKTWGGSPLLSLVTAQYYVEILFKTLLEKIKFQIFR